MLNRIKYLTPILLLTILLTYIYAPFYLKGLVQIGRLFYYSLSFLPFLSFLLLRPTVKISKDFYFWLMLLFLYISQVLFVPLITISFDFNYILTTFRFGVTWITGCLSILCLYNFINGRTVRNIVFFKIVLNAFSFYIVGTILFIAIPGLREFWLSSIDINNEYQKKLVNEIFYVTRFGFGGYTGFSFAFYVSSCSLILTFLFINKLVSAERTMFYLFILSLGGVFYARTGIVVVLFTFLWLFLYCLYKRRGRLVLYAFLVLSCIFIIGFVVYFSVPTLKPFFYWFLSPILNYFNTGKLETGSTNILIDFYRNFHPSDKTFFIGDGHWGNSDGSYYGKTDVGFMRNIYYGGIFYMLAQYSLVILLITLIYLKMKQLNYKGFIFIPLMLFMHFVIFEMKGDIAFLFMQQYIPFLIVITHPEYLSAEHKHTTRKIGLIKKYALHFNAQM